MYFVSSCSCLCPIHWSQVLSWEWRCSWSSADRRCSNYIWVINNSIANYDVSYIRGLIVNMIDGLKKSSNWLSLFFGVWQPSTPQWQYNRQSDDHFVLTLISLFKCCLGWECHNLSPIRYAHCCAFGKKTTKLVPQPILIYCRFDDAQKPEGHIDALA